jgi:pimeloyl-ACP methyl ester carboxylesterase
MHVVTAGRGPLVVLLHGFPEFWYSWRYQIPALAEHFRVVAPDQRGYNLTEKPRTGYNIRTLTTDIAELIRYLGYERAHVVGHDWGGSVAWWLAIARSDLVERLVILNAPHPAAFVHALRSNPRQLLRSWYMFFFQVPKLPELAFRLGNYRAIEESFRRDTTRPEAFTDAVIARYKRAVARPGALTAMINWYRAAIRPRMFRVLQGRDLTVRVPTLVIWGEQDRYLGKELNADLHRWVPDLTLRYIPDASHWVQQDRPEEVNRYLVEFLVGAGD